MGLFLLACYDDDESRPRTEEATTSHAAKLVRISMHHQVIILWKRLAPATYHFGGIYRPPLFLSVSLTLKPPTKINVQANLSDLQIADCSRFQIPDRRCQFLGKHGQALLQSPTSCPFRRREPFPLAAVVGVF